MTGKRRTLFVEAPLMALLALAAGVVLGAGAASAKYLGVGAVQNGITGGWVTPNDMVCIVGVHTDGTLDVAPGVTNSRDCIYRTTGLTGMNPVDVTTSSMCGAGLPCNIAANCTGTNATTLGSLTWNATDSKCYDSAPCTVAGLAAGVYGGITYPANNGARHAIATSICVDGSGNGISLTSLDRTAQMCAAKGGIWKQTSATAPPGFPGTFPTAGFGGACVAYTRQFAGQDANGVPLAFGPKGTTTAQGSFCYATMTTGIASANCPSVAGSSFGTKTDTSSAAFGYSATSTACTHSFGVKGKPSSDLTKPDGTLNPKTVVLDLTGVTTMGDCLAQGATWNTWIPMGTAGIPAIAGATATVVTFDLTTQAAASTEGCLHCHSTLTEYNGPSEREKDSYLKTGHKNMLRKVTAGKKWAGPCAAGDIPNADGLCVYTTDGTNAINFMTPSDPFGKVTVGGVDQNLYYIFGDWMVRNPTLVYGTNGYGPTIGANNGYSCYACHTTGAKDNSNPGVQSIGTPGYAGVEPQASFPGISLNAANPKWDLDGINCSRCHNATAQSVTQSQISGGSCSYNAAQCATAGGVMSTGSNPSCSINAAEIYLTQAACTAGTPAIGTWTTASGVASSFPTTHATAGGMGALAAGTGRTNLCFGCHQSIASQWPAGTSQKDPTLIPTGVSHGAAAGRDFNGHVLGNSFLNSVHAKYAGAQSGPGSITLNSLGKFDLTDPSGTSEYGSLFKGYTCWQGPTSNSPAKTKADGSEIKTKSDCETLYGAGSWRADGSGDLGTKQGTCSTCHDVHNSLFIEDQAEAALRKKCEDCHVNNRTTGATDSTAPQVVVAKIAHPMGGGTPFDSSKYDSACVVCHMAAQAEANGNQNSMPVHLWRINTDPTYSTFPTIGQFYGGTCSAHTGAVQNAPYLPVVYLSDISQANCTAASGTWTPVTKDRNAQTAPDGSYTKAVWVDLDLACGQCHGGSFGASATANNAPYISKADLATYAAGIHNNAPQVNFAYTLGNPNTLTVSVFAQASCTGPCSPYDWDWGDGSAHGSGASATHTYNTGGAYPITLAVQGGAGSMTKNVSVYTPDLAPTVSGMNCSTIQNGSTAPSITTNWTASFTDSSSDDNGVSLVTVNWGDGSPLEIHGQGAPFGPHTYGGPGKYTITHKALDTIGQQNIETCTVTLSYFTIGGTVKDSGGTGLPSATVVVRNSATGSVAASASTAIDGSFSAGSLRPATYQLAVTPPLVCSDGVTQGGEQCTTPQFADPAVTITVGPSSMGNVIQATGTIGAPDSLAATALRAPANSARRPVQRRRPTRTRVDR